MSDWKLIEALFTENLNSEPSFETGLGSWTTAGSNLIAQSASEQYRGVYSAKVTYKDDAGFAQYPFTAPNAGTFTLSAWVWISAGFDGDNVRITGINYASGSEKITAQWVNGTSPRGWFRLQTAYTFDVGDLVGSISIRVPGGDEPSVDEIIHIDAVDIVAGSLISTHVDGDQENCEWLGTPHASKSQRVAEGRAGGIARDVEDHFDLALGQHVGAGDIQHVVIVDEYTLQPGGELQRVTNESRVMQWNAQFSAATRSGLHDKRQALLRALSVDEVVTDNRKPQETRMIYTGAAVTKYIDVVLESGLGAVFRARDCFMERLGLSFVAADPIWRGLEDNGAVLPEAENSVSLESVLGRLRSGNGLWDVLGPPSSGGEINTVVRGDDGDTYWGGNFLNFDGIAAADRVVRRDTQAGIWHAVGAGLNGRVRGSAKAPNGDIYFVGDFDDVSGGPGGTYNYIVKWDVSAGVYVAVMVSGPNNGLNAAAYACAFGTNGKLYIAGLHTDVDGGPGGTYNYVIEYDPQTDTVAALGTGLAGAAVIGKAVSSNPINGHVIIGGVFSTADGVSVSNVADWTPATATTAGSFAAMGNGLGVAGVAGAVNTIVTNTLGRSFAFGEFGTGTFNHAAQFDGQQWLVMGNGLIFDSLLPPPVSIRGSTIAPDGTVIAAGLFNKAGDVFAPGFAGWNGNDWFRFDMKNAGNPFAVLADNPDPLNDSLYDLWLGYGVGVASFDRAVQTPVTNAGTADTYPVFRIQRSGTTGAPKAVAILNEITGYGLRLDYRLQDGEELVIDTNPLSFSITSNFYGPRQSALVKASDVGFFSFKPGFNIISVFVELGTTPAADVTVTAQWRDAYKSFD